MAETSAVRRALTEDKKVTEITAPSDLASESDIEKITVDVAELTSPEESIFINGHEVRRTGDREWHVGTAFGNLIFDNPDSVARFCIRAGFSKVPGTASELKEKVLSLHQRVSRMEAELGLPL